MIEILSNRGSSKCFEKAELLQLPLGEGDYLLLEGPHSAACPCLLRRPAADGEGKSAIVL